MISVTKILHLNTCSVPQKEKELLKKEKKDNKIRSRALNKLTKKEKEVLGL
jgi:hypothetical protein